MYQRDNEVLYSYDLSVTFLMYVGLLIALIVMVVSLVGLVVELVDPAQTFWDRSDIPPPWDSVFGILLSFSLFTILANIYPNIRVSDQGTAVQVFLFWWVFVPWEEIEDIQDSFVAGPRTQIIIVRQLTPVHRLFGLYGLTLRPAFRISRRLEGYHDAMRTIRKKTGISQNSRLSM